MLSCTAASKLPTAVQPCRALACWTRRCLCLTSPSGELACVRLHVGRWLRRHILWHIRPAAARRAARGYNLLLSVLPFPSFFVPSRDTSVDFLLRERPDWSGRWSIFLNYHKLVRIDARRMVCRPWALLRGMCMPEGTSVWCMHMSRMRQQGGAACAC